MNLFNNLSQKLVRRTISLQEYLENAQDKCMQLSEEVVPIESQDHVYSMEDTKKELGLDDGLIDSLIEDFVVQIISNIPLFKKYAQENDLTILKELTHKNLGVARNLRIKDMQKILKEIMNKDDVEGILKCIDYLEACAVVLKPEVAYEAYKKR